MFPWHLRQMINSHPRRHSRPHPYSNTTNVSLTHIPSSPNVQNLTQPVQLQSVQQSTRHSAQQSTQHSAQQSTQHSAQQSVQQSIQQSIQQSAQPTSTSPAFAFRLPQLHSNTNNSFFMNPTSQTVHQQAELDIMSIVASDVEKHCENLKKQLIRSRKSNAMLREQAHQLGVELSIRHNRLREVESILAEVQTKLEETTAKPTSTLNDKYTCQICETSGFDTALECGHTFCNSCVERWRKEKQKKRKHKTRKVECPVCKSKSRAFRLYSR